MSRLASGSSSSSSLRKKNGFLCRASKAASAAAGSSRSPVARWKAASRCVDEGPVEGLELDRGGEMEERRLLVGEHRRQRVAVGAGEHGGEPVATLVEAGAQRGDERAVRRLGRELLHLVEHEHGRLGLARELAQQLIHQQQHVARRRALEAGEIDLRPRLADAGQLGADLELRAEALGEPLQLPRQAAFLLAFVERRQQRRHGRERRLPEARVHDAMARLSRRAGRDRRIRNSVLPMRRGPNSTSALAEALLDQRQRALGKLGAGIVPGIGRGHQ